MGPDQDQTRDPGSAVRHASVARHVTDCATRPDLLIVTFEWETTSTVDFKYGALDFTVMLNVGSYFM